MSDSAAKGMMQRPASASVMQRTVPIFKPSLVSNMALMSRMVPKSWWLRFRNHPQTSTNSDEPSLVSNMVSMSRMVPYLTGVRFLTPPPNEYKLEQGEFGFKYGTDTVVMPAVSTRFSRRRVSLLAVRKLSPL